MVHYLSASKRTNLAFRPLGLFYYYSKRRGPPRAFGEQGNIIRLFQAKEKGIFFG